MSKTHSAPKPMKGDICIHDADLTHVRGVSPHYWKLVNGVIFPMNTEEQATKNINYDSFRIFKTIRVPVSKRDVLIALASFAFGILVSCLIIKHGGK